MAASILLTRLNTRQGKERSKWGSTTVSFANWGFICLSYLFQIVFEILPGEDGGMHGISGLPPGRSARLGARGNPSSVLGKGKNAVNQVPSPFGGFAFAMAPDICQCLRIWRDRGGPPENLIGYTLTEQVQINMTTGAFEKIRVQPDTVNKASDRALLSLLEGQAALIKSLTEKVNSLSEAPTRSEKSVPPLCLKELHELALVWNHPQWVTRVLYYLKCAILEEALPLDAMRMTPKWDDEAQKPLLSTLSDDQKKDTTVWTEVVGTGDSAGDAPMDDSSGTPPPPGVFLEQLCGVMVESLWLLVWSSIHCYKERYESDSTSSKQASADPDFTSGLSTAGARLKKVMRRRFKMVDGVEDFEVRKGEWVRSDSRPSGSL